MVSTHADTSSNTPRFEGSFDVLLVSVVSTNNLQDRKKLTSSPNTSDEEITKLLSKEVHISRRDKRSSRFRNFYIPNLPERFHYGRSDNKRYHKTVHVCIIREGKFG